MFKDRPACLIITKDYMLTQQGANCRAFYGECSVVQIEENSNIKYLKVGSEYNSSPIFISFDQIIFISPRDSAPLCYATPGVRLLGNMIDDIYKVE